MNAFRKEKSNICHQNWLTYLETWQILTRDPQFIEIGDPCMQQTDLISVTAPNVNARGEWLYFQISFIKQSSTLIIMLRSILDKLGEIRSNIAYFWHGAGGTPSISQPEIMIARTAIPVNFPSLSRLSAF